MKEQDLKKAVLWDADGNKKVRCKLCNWRCLIDEGRTGRCAVRKNIDGILYCLNYHKICAANPDYIEKKPLFHFQPATLSFSIATMGCNFRCQFCQNWQISQAAYDKGEIDGRDMTAEQIVTAAIESGCKSLAYTYTEPAIFMELCADCGRLAKKKGLANVFVSNGYMTTEAIDFAGEWLDGINIDLKAFSEDYYRKLCKAELKPVLETIKYIAQNTDIWLEITTLLVPGQNDSDDELKKLAEFIAAHAGVDVPWHISRFHPQYKYTDSIPTPLSTMQRAERIGRQAGLRYVYLGNVPGTGENTYCYNCGKLLVERAGYSVGAYNITDGRCRYCGAEIAGVGL